MRNLIIFNSKNILNIIYIFILWLFIYLTKIYSFDTFLKNIISNINVSYNTSVTLNNGIDILLLFITGIFIFLIIFLIGSILYNITKQFTHYIEKKKSFLFDNVVYKIILKFINISKYIFAFYYAIACLNLSNGIINFINKILFNVVIISVALYLISGLINSVFEEILKRNKENSKLSVPIFTLIPKTIIAVIWIMGILTILSGLGYNISAIIAGLGIGGLAMALAAQKTVANVIGAISIILNKPFIIGEKITIGGSTGRVKDIGFIYITLKTEDDGDVLVPNETILSTAIQNHSR